MNVSDVNKDFQLFLASFAECRSLIGCFVSAPGLGIKFLVDSNSSQRNIGDERYLAKATCFKDSLDNTRIYTLV